LQEIKFNLSNRFIEQQEFGTTMLDFFSNFMSTRIREKRKKKREVSIFKATIDVFYFNRINFFAKSNFPTNSNSKII
jgi:hypothetical protein